LLVARPGKVRVEWGQLSARPVVTLSNGVLRFHVCGDVGGNLIRLEDNEGRTYLHDHHPEVRPRLVVDYHIGGVEPHICCPGDEPLFSEPEDVAIKVVEEGCWKGACAAWTVRHHRTLMPFIGPTHLRAPWAWVGKRAGSLTMVVPEGGHGCAIPFDMGTMMGALLTAELVTEPFGEERDRVRPRAEPAARWGRGADPGA
jgi:hypothetical protein